MTIRHSDFTIVSQVSVEPQHVLVLVGTALDGPSHTPFSLNADVDPHEALGQTPLADAYNAARRVGMNNIIAYRLNGAHATALLKDDYGKEVMSFRSISGTFDSNSIKLNVFPTHLFVTRTDGVSRSYFFDKYPTAQDLAYAINLDARYGLLEFNATVIDEYYQMPGIVAIQTDVLFTGGLDEEHLVNSRDPKAEAPTDASLVVSELKERLKVALFGEDLADILSRSPNSELGSLHYGVIALCDMFHDDDPELTEMLGAFCLHKTNESGVGSIGVIGTKPIYEPLLDEGEVSDTEAFTHEKVLELVELSDSLPDEEAYKYIQVIVGQTAYAESDATSISLAYAYAATQAQFPYYTMMSNKAITGVGKLNTQITKEDIALLTANGYTCIVPSIRRGFVPYYATSYSKDKESLMAKPHNLRISQYISQVLVEELDWLVGSNYAALSIKEALDKAVELLNGFVTSQVIKSYELDYELSKNNTMLDIQAALTTFSEVKAINSMATISFPQGVIR